MTVKNEKSLKIILFIGVSMQISIAADRITLNKDILQYYRFKAYLARFCVSLKGRIPTKFRFGFSFQPIGLTPFGSDFVSVIFGCLFGLDASSDKQKG